MVIPRSYMKWSKQPNLGQKEVVWGGSVLQIPLFLKAHQVAKMCVGESPSREKGCLASQTTCFWGWVPFRTYYNTYSLDPAAGIFSKSHFWGSLLAPDAPEESGTTEAAHLLFIWQALVKDVGPSEEKDRGKHRPSSSCPTWKQWDLLWYSDFFHPKTNKQTNKSKNKNKKIPKLSISISLSSYHLISLFPSQSNFCRAMCTKVLHYHPSHSLLDLATIPIHWNCTITVTNNFLWEDPSEAVPFSFPWITQLHLTLLVSPLFFCSKTFFPWFS